MVLTRFLTAALSLAPVTHIKTLTSTRSPQRGCRGHSAVPGREMFNCHFVGPVEWNHFPAANPAQGGVERPPALWGQQRDSAVKTVLRTGSDHFIASSWRGPVRVVSPGGCWAAGLGEAPGLLLQDHTRKSIGFTE